MRPRSRGPGSSFPSMTDTFERASLGSNWSTVLGTATIANSSDWALASGNICISNWVGTGVAADQAVEAVISSSKPANMLAQPYVRRRSSDAARYGFGYDDDPTFTPTPQWYIKYDGVPTEQTRLLATNTTRPAPVANDRLKIEATGSNPVRIRAWHNDQLVFDITDSAAERITTGVPGLVTRPWSGETPTYPAPVFESFTVFGIQGGSGSAQLVADGTDQTENFRALIASYPDGTLASPTVINLPAGTYRIDGGMQISDRSHLRINGPSSGTPFVAYSNLDSVALGISPQIGCGMTRCTNVVWSYVRWEGPNTNDDASNPGYALYSEARANDHCFAIRSGCVDCGFQNCSGKNAYGDGLYVGYHNDGIANDGCFAKFLTVEHCGRQGFGLTHATDFLMEDSSFDWCGRSGLDIEPNHQFDKVWDVIIRRTSMGSQFYPWVIGGASNGALPQRKNVTLENCTTIRCASNHPAVLANRSPSDGTLTVTGLTDTRNSNRYGLIITGGWPNATITGCTVTTARNTPVSYAVQSSVTGTLTVQNNTFNGKPGTEGFDQLIEQVVAPATLVKSGNVWAMGTQSD